MKLSVLMPVYNEESTIERIIERGRKRRQATFGSSLLGWLMSLPS